MKIPSAFCRLLLVAFIGLLAGNARAVDMQQIEKDLTTTGLEGWMHGAIKDKGIYVFTYRSPKDFFDYVEMSLVSADKDILNKLAAFNRHDKIRVKGNFMQNPSPQKHISVSSVELIKKYDPSYKADEYGYNASVPAELLRVHEATFMIHAIAEDGHILVAEYKDAVVPIFAADNTPVKDLSRNDLVKLSYIVQQHPGQPMHLLIDASAKEPVKMIEAIKDYDKKPAKVEGALVLFPKSPEIIFNVFAVLQEREGGLNRQFTIVNFERPEVFKAAREKMQQAWDRHPNDFINGRNKLISKKIRVRVRGTYNQVSANQANPQILIDSADDVEVIED